MVCRAHVVVSNSQELAKLDDVWISYHKYKKGDIFSWTSVVISFVNKDDGKFEIKCYSEIAVTVGWMQEMSESSEQHRVLTDQNTQLTAEFTALSNSMDKVCWCSYRHYIY